MTEIIANMTGWLIAAILAQRRDEDGGGWMQLLVFLVMAVFYIISKLVKARSGKQEEEEEEEGITIQLPPMRRRPIPQPQGPTGERKIFSHKMAEPAAVPEAVTIPPIEEAPPAKLAEMPEAAEHEAVIPSADLIALAKHDELAKGIIYSEILGKPLALRESWMQE